MTVFGSVGAFALLLLAAVVVFILLRRKAAEIVGWLEKHLPPGFPARTLVISALALAAAGAFTAVAGEVVEHETSAFDLSVGAAIHGLASPAMDFTMRLLTAMGSPEVIVVAVALALFDTSRRRDRRATWSLAAVSTAAGVFNWLLKTLIGRARPAPFGELSALHSYSFPSGHAMTATAIYGMIGVVLAREHPQWRTALAIAIPTLVVLIGLSRIYLGVHWPTDVIAGWAAGMTLVLVGLAVLVLRRE